MSSTVLLILKLARFEHEITTFFRISIVFPEPLLPFQLLTPQNFQVGYFGFMQIKMLGNRIDL